ncbi:hypothetical protein BG004_008436 [Podila humilis]|nr:hypothetical protein BG004_008436 [Podila humilis]
MEDRGTFIAIPEFEHATPLRIAGNGGTDIQVLSQRYGLPVAWTVEEPGQIVEPQKILPGDDSQLFRVLPMRPGMRHEKFSSNDCIPGVDVQLYESFHLKSTALGTVVSRAHEGFDLVGGVDGDKNFQQLEMCFIMLHGACNPPTPVTCLALNRYYRIKVLAPVEGYLRAVGGTVRIVPNFLDGTLFSLIKEDGWGLHIAQVNDDPFGVLETSGKGNTINLSPYIENTAEQSFTIEKMQ